MFAGEYRGTPAHPPDLAAVLARAWGAGVAKIIVTAGSVAESRAALALARSSSPAAADVAACLFGLAECLLQGAEAVLAACAQLPDQTLSVAAVQQADGQAVALLEESVGAFGRVREPDGQPRVDALVCGGNALRYGGLWIKVGVPPGPSLPAAFDSNHPRPAHPCRCMRQLLG